MSPAAPGSESSASLVAAIAAGDRDAFGRFYDLTAPIAFGPSGIARDREATSYPGVRDQVEPHLRRWVDRPVVRSEVGASSQW